MTLARLDIPCNAWELGCWVGRWGSQTCRFLEDFRVFPNDPRPSRHPLQRLGWVVGRWASQKCAFLEEFRIFQNDPQEK